MKFLKLSLAASVALGAFSTASFAQPLEEAIKGVDVSGFLRYRYNDDRFDNGNDNVNGSNATHRWRAQADFKTPVVNSVAMNLGIMYSNERQNVNHGNGHYNNGNLIAGTQGLGTGLGAGKDGEFGVSTFYATITPDITATTVMIGKQRLATPVTDAGDDRATGILALNNDITGLTLVGGAFDSWSLDDMFAGYNGDETSVDKPLYTLAAIYNTDTSFGNIGAQAWGFYVQDLVDASGFLELSWKGSLLNAKLQYALAKLANDEALAYRRVAQANDLLSFQIGADFTNDFNIPLEAKLGYITNFQDGTAVMFDDEGALAKAGKLWWQNSGTGITSGITFGLGKTLDGGYNTSTFANEAEINVFYGALSYGFIENRLRVGLEGVYGESELTAHQGGAKVSKVEFTEITPTISWQHNKNLNISAFYAMLSTEFKDTNSPDQDRNRARVEVKYSF
ncbi:major outer membrane protein [Helicobacter winghamensis]|uniref:major outer membrane protein n=1 Tax=Helicobacter winghamensis TaxID=157268 RepID=UPI00242EBF68|nr:major outer membrane protein [Helicobacter winghamensis]